MITMRVSAADRLNANGPYQVAVGYLQHVFGREWVTEHILKVRPSNFIGVARGRLEDTRACVQLSRIIAAAICTPARKFLASLS
jgi:hypothetical protein